MNLVSNRIETKYSLQFIINHLFLCSHKRKIYDLENTLWFGDRVEKYKRDVSKLQTNVKDIRKFFKEQTEKRQDDYKKNGKKKKMRSDSHLNYSGIITFGNDDDENTLTREEMDNVNQVELDAAAHERVKKVLDSLGIPENEYILRKHVDETQIHYHYEFVGYDFKKHELCRRRLSRRKLIEVQDLTGERFKDLDFHRGITKLAKVERQLESMGITGEDYKKMTPLEKLDILKKAGVKNVKNRKKYNEINKKVKDMTHVFETSLLTAEDIKKRVLEKSITIDELEEMKSHQTIKPVKTFLNYRIRFLKRSEDAKQQEKQRKLLTEKRKKIDESVNFELKVLSKIKEKIAFEKSKEDFVENVKLSPAGSKFEVEMVEGVQWEDSNWDSKILRKDTEEEVVKEVVEEESYSERQRRELREFAEEQRLIREEERQRKLLDECQDDIVLPKQPEPKEEPKPKEKPKPEPKTQPQKEPDYPSY